MDQKVKEFYSVTEIAKRIGKSRQRVLQIIKEKDVKKERHANTFAIPKSELYKFG